jgi:aldose 1-epimerase
MIKYKINEGNFGNYRTVEAVVGDNADRIVVSPEMGATILDLFLSGTKILDTYSSPENLAQHNGNKNVILFPFPNRLEDGQYSYGGNSYQFPINDTSFGNAIHGFGMFSAFNFAKHESTEDEVILTFSSDYRAERDYFPFEAQINIIYALNGKGGFRFSMEVKNLSNKDFPLGIGFHPYFLTHGPSSNVILEIPYLKRSEVNERMIPTGQYIPFDDFTDAKTLGDIKFDDCFLISHMGQDLTLTMETPLGKLIYKQSPGTGKFNYLQLFTPSSGDSIAIEPMSCNIDAFHNRESLTRLLANEKIKATFRIQWNPKVVI